MNQIKQEDCTGCRDGKWHKSCLRLSRAILSRAIVESQGTSDERPVVEFFQFVFIWVVACSIFLGTLFVIGWFVAYLFYLYQI